MTETYIIGDLRGKQLWSEVKVWWPLQGGIGMFSTVTIGMCEAWSTP